MKRGVITVGREYGSGGRIVAKMVADELGVPFYDKELISMAAAKTGLSPEFIKRSEERRTSGFLYDLNYPSQTLPLQDQVFIAQSNIIRKIAGEGPCVIVGRCSDYILSKTEGCLHVFIYAPIEERIKRVRDDYGTEGDDRAIEDEIRRRDKERASFYSNFTMNKWGARENYHAMISSSIGIEEAAQSLICMAQGVGK